VSYSICKKFWDDNFNLQAEERPGQSEKVEDEELEKKSLSDSISASGPTRYFYK